MHAGTTRCAATRSRCFVHEDGDTIAEVTFQGAGCSISQSSSASMMTEAVTGKTVDEALDAGRPSSAA